MIHLQQKAREHAPGLAWFGSALAHRAGPCNDPHRCHAAGRLAFSVLGAFYSLPIQSSTPFLSFFLVTGKAKAEGTLSDVAR